MPSDLLTHSLVVAHAVSSTANLEPTTSVVSSAVAVASAAASASPLAEVSPGLTLLGTVASLILHVKESILDIGVSAFDHLPGTQSKVGTGHVFPMDSDTDQIDLHVIGLESGTECYDQHGNKSTIQTNSWIKKYFFVFDFADSTSKSIHGMLNTFCSPNRVCISMICVPENCILGDLNTPQPYHMYQWGYSYINTPGLYFDPVWNQTRFNENVLIYLGGVHLDNIPGAYSGSGVMQPNEGVKDSFHTINHWGVKRSVSELAREAFIRAKARQYSNDSDVD